MEEGSTPAEHIVGRWRVCVMNLTNRRKSSVYRRGKAKSWPSFGQLTPQRLIVIAAVAADG